MPLVINLGQKDMIVPRVLSRIYRYRSFDPVITVVVDGGTKLPIDVRTRINNAWIHIENNCAKNKDCNAYFAKLRRGKTLASIMKDVAFTAHCLTPREGHTEEELPYANSEGVDFAVSVIAFVVQDSTPALAATVLHEIAHYAGATTNRDDDNALEAENALVPCGLKQFFNKDAKG